MNELITLENINPLEIFTVDGVDPILKAINEEVKKFTPNMSTSKGRAEIASMARKIASSKTFLDDAGKKLVEEAKQKCKVVDASRKKIRDHLDELKDEVRKPLTDWENAEKERVRLLKEKVESIIQAATFPYETSLQIQEKGEEIFAMVIDSTWQEFELQATAAKNETLSILDKKYEVLFQSEQNKIEIERMRKEEYERKLKEDAARIATELANKKANEDIVKARLAEEMAVKEKKDMEARLARAEQESRDAVEKEQRRVQKEKELEDEAKKKREADVEHKKNINNLAVEKMVDETGLSVAECKTIITLIAQGKIPGVSIKY